MKNQDLSLIVTDDGSHTIYSKQFDSCYHSTHGAIQESMHIFISDGLRHFKHLNTHLTDIHILEIGFGTGLNALLSMQFAEKNKINLYYSSLEAFPLNPEVAAKLNYTEKLSIPQMREAFLKMHMKETLENEKISAFFTLNKSQIHFDEFEYKKNQFDIIFFDPFDYNTKSTFWEFEYLNKLFNSLKTGGMLLTYGAKGSFKRALRKAGFKLEPLPGPPGKREITRAVK